MPVLPIVTYNDPVLRQPTEPVTPETPGLQELIDDMTETMYNANGIGLAAPQVGKSLRLFVVDADPVIERASKEKRRGLMVFLNPQIVTQKGTVIEIEEGCLSLPGLTEIVKRHDVIEIKWEDREFNEHQEEIGKWLSRVIQHEYDHLEGILFFDHLGSFRRRLLKSRLQEIDLGQVTPEYPCREKGESQSQG